MDQNKRPKTRNGTRQNHVEARDRLSELPDAIIHHILSFIPTVYAVRMSLLSSRWRYLWLALPVLDLSSFGGIMNSRKLFSFVKKCLAQRKVDLLESTGGTITKFKLRTNQTSKNINAWLKLVAKSNVKELDLHIHMRMDTYSLCMDVLQMRSLTHLTLDRVSIEDCDSISLPSLTFLSLEDVCLNDRVLDNLLLNCPSLEKLIVYQFDGLSSPKLSSPSLKFLNFRSRNIGELQLEAASLETLVYSGEGIDSKSNLAMFESLRNLSFYSMKLDDQWLEDLILKLTRLESFTLTDCAPASVRIRNHNLKHFVYRPGTYSNKLQLVMDAPSLVYFCFYGPHTWLDLSMQLPNLQEAKLKLGTSKYDAAWYTSLLHIFSNLACAKTMFIHVNSEEALILPPAFRENDCKTPSLTIKHVKVRTSKALLRSDELKDSLFFMMPSLETLSMEQEKVLSYHRRFKVKSSKSTISSDQTRMR